MKAGRISKRIGRSLLGPLIDIHRPDGRPNVFLFSSPRSGSTWLMELICSQPGFGYCESALDINLRRVGLRLGMTEWEELHRPDARRLLRPYFQGLCDGTDGRRGGNLFRKRFRPLTRRLVFKLIHGGEDHVGWLAANFNGRVVHLLRHPIAVSLSRESYPRLTALLKSEYRRHFPPDVLTRAERIATAGSKLERGVLTWCLENAVPLRQRTKDWAVITYEQLVIDPEPVIAELAAKLSLPDPGRMMCRLSSPSGSTYKSSADTRALLQSQDRERRNTLVQKWRKRVTEGEERTLTELLRWFEIDAYQAGDDLPASWLWLPGQQASTYAPRAN